MEEMIFIYFIGVLYKNMGLLKYFYSFLENRTPSEEGIKKEYIYALEEIIEKVNNQKIKEKVEDIKENLKNNEIDFKGVILELRVLDNNDEFKSIMKNLNTGYRLKKRYSTRAGKSKKKKRHTRRKKHQK